MQIHRRIPLMQDCVPAGFPSPAEDLVERAIDLNDRLIHNDLATFFVRARGDSMTGAGILSGDLLIVDRALEPQEGDIVVARVDDGFTVKRWRRHGRMHLLVPENPEYPILQIGGDRSFEIWGVVTYAVHPLNPQCRF